MGGFGHRENPTRLAARVTSWLKSNNANHSSGTQLFSAFPELQYVIPTDLRQLSRCLEGRGFSLEFTRSGIVNQVVSYVTR
jgi:hypothetical protein